MERISVEIWLMENASHLGSPIWRELAFIPRVGEYMSLNIRGVSGRVERIEYHEAGDRSELVPRIYLQRETV